MCAPLLFSAACFDSKVTRNVTAGTLGTTDPTNFGQVEVGRSADLTVKFTNSGGDSAEITALTASTVAAPFGFKGGSFPGTGGTCTTTLAAGANCKVVLTYAPTQVGTSLVTGALDYTENHTTHALTVTLAGQGVVPRAILAVSDATTYNYGDVNVGSSADKIFTLGNTGLGGATSIVGMLAPATAGYTFKGGTYPGTGGTCVATLPAGTTCTIVVTFAPGGFGAATSTLTVQYNDNHGIQSATRPLTGNGVQAALTFSDTPTFPYPTVTAGTVTDHTFTVTNGGDITASAMGAGLPALGAPFSFKGNAYPGTGGNCGATLAAGASCTVVVTYAPVTAGTTSDIVRLSYSDGLTTQTATLGVTGTAILAALSLSDGPTFDYKAQVAGSTTDHIFTVTNNGGFGAASMVAGSPPLGGPYSFKGGIYPGTGGTCTATLAAAATCTVVVTYAPNAFGTTSDTVRVQYYDGQSTTSATVDVTGHVPAASLTIGDGPTFDYGDHTAGTATDHDFLVTNDGGVTAKSMAAGSPAFGTAFSFKGGTYPGTGGDCGPTLAPGASCNVVVTFSSATFGPQTDDLNIAYDDGTGPQTASRAVTGNVPAAVLAISDSPKLDYGNQVVGSSTDHDFTVTNTGGFTATAMAAGTPALGGAFSFTGGGGYPGSGGTCGATLAPGAPPCHIFVTFAPKAAGNATDTVRIDYHDGSTTPQTATRDVTGNVLPAVLAISDGPTYNFGDRAAGSSTDHTFDVTNNGGAAASLMAAGSPPLGGTYHFKGGAYPGTGGNCGVSLPPAGKCQIVVTFSPNVSAEGPSADTVRITYADGLNLSAQTATRDVAGNVPPAALAISGGPTFDYGPQVVGSSTSKSFDVTNNGGATATAMTAGSPAMVNPPFGFNGGAYPGGGGGNCGTSLLPGQTCQIVVTFSPQAVSTPNDTIRVAYNDGTNTTQTATLPIQGSGVLASLLISDGPTYDYGNRAANSATDHTFDVTNTGGLGASLMGAGSPPFSLAYSFKGNSYPGTGGNCGATLAPGATCQIVVTFSPTVEGISASTINVAYNDGKNSQTAARPVTGNVPPAVLTITDVTTNDFGSQILNASTDRSFTVTNSAGAVATSLGAGSPPFVSTYTFKGGNFPGTGGNCTSTLNPSAFCTIVVTSTPTAIGTFNDTVRVAYNDGTNTTQNATRAVTGKVVPASLGISDAATYDYGPQVAGSNTDHPFTITNAGGVPATSVAAGSPALGPPFGFKGGNYPGTGGSCTATIAPGSPCTVVVTFSPQLAGTLSDILRVAYNDGQASQTATRAVQGTGVLAVLSISDGSTFDYGNVAQGTSHAHPFTVTNTGGYDAASMGAGTPALAAPFSFTGGNYPGTNGTCGTALAAGANCLLDVTYAPASAGTSNSTIRVTYFDGKATQTATRAVKGTVPPAVLVLSDSPLYDFGGVAVGSTGAHPFTVTNTGGATATLMAPGTPAMALPFNFAGGAYPGTNGNCGSILAPGAPPCTIVVTFSPTGETTSADTVRVSYFDGVQPQTAGQAITGTGELAHLALSDGPTYTFPPWVTGSTEDHIFTLSNSGLFDGTSVQAGSPALGAPYSFKGGAYPGSGGTCGATVAASSQCTVVLTFAPTVAGSTSDTARVSYFDGQNSQVAGVGVAGTAVNPASLSIDGGVTFDFGNVYPSSTNEHQFTVTNSGDVSATSVVAGTPSLASPFSFAGGSYPGTGGTCAATIAKSATCTVVVDYTPTTPGTNSDTVRLSYNNGANTVTASDGVTGTAAKAAALSLSDGPTYDYGYHGTGTPTNKTFTLTNAGPVGGQAIITSASFSTAPFTFTGNTGYPGTGGNCTSPMPNGSSCFIVTTFTPAAAGLDTDTLVVNYNDGVGTNKATRPVKGNGTTPGLLDTSWNTAGVAYTDFSTTDDEAYGIAQQSNSRIVAVGQEVQGGTSAVWGIARYNTDGSADTSFNTSGRNTLAFTGAYDEARAVVIQASDQKIVVAGTSDGGGTTAKFAVARFTTAGILDASTYGTTGKTTTAIGTTSRAYGAALQTSDGKVVVAGSSTTGTVRQFALARYTTAGALDTGNFNSGGSQPGTVLTAFGTNAAAYAVTVQASDGKIVAAGYGNGGFCIARYTTAGALDTANFGSPNGTVTTSFTGSGATALAVAMDGTKIVVGGYVTVNGSYDWALARYNSDGTLDTSFNTTGTLTYDVATHDDQIHGIAVQADHKIVVVGYYNDANGTHYAVARFTSAGALDATFGTAGISTIGIANASVEANAVLLQSSNAEIVSAGTYYLTTGSFYDFAIARFWP